MAAPVVSAIDCSDEPRKELDDFIPIYRSLQEPHPQAYLASKKEFAELRTSPNEPPPKARGEYYNHQEELGRLMMLTDRMFIFWEPGTGKSCGVGSVAERLKKLARSTESLRQSEFTMSSNYKKCIILVKGDTLVQEFKNQLVRVCTPPGEYDTPAVLNATSETARRSLITRELNKWYEITTYGTFTNRLAKIRKDSGDAALIESYEDTMFFVDEIHNLRTDCTSAKRRKASVRTNKSLPQTTGETVSLKGQPGQVLDQLLSINADDDVDEAIKNTFAKERREAKKSYNELFHLFHILQRAKVMLGSGSPMINDPCEIGHLMNLILPITDEDGTPRQFPADFDYWNATVEQYEPYFRGRISSVKVLDTGVDLVYHGQHLKTTQRQLVEIPGPSGQPIIREEITEVNLNTIIFPSIMEPYQDSVYAKEVAEGPKSVYQNQRQASSIVYPGGMIGNKAYEYYVGEYEKILRKKKSGGFASKSQAQAHRRGRATKSVEAEETREQREARLVHEQELKERYDNFMAILGNLSEAKNYAAKYANIVSIELEASRRILEIDPVTQQPKKAGNSFIYSHFVYIGANTIGKMFEAVGYARFTEDTPIFISDPDDPLNERRIERNVRSDFPREGGPAKRPRIAILTPGAESRAIQTMMDTFNSYENRYGEYIQAIIGSPVSRDGINLMNVVRIQLADAGWNPSDSFQAKHRGIRSTSHIDLLYNAKQNLAQRGLNPNDARVIIDIYNHVAISRIAHESVDVLMYLVSEEKEAAILRVENIMNTLAVDSLIHYERNHHATQLRKRKLRPAGERIEGPTAANQTSASRVEESNITGVKIGIETPISQLTEPINVGGYDLLDPRNYGRDKSTYDILYSDRIVNLMIPLIKGYFVTHAVASIDEITELITTSVRETLNFDQGMSQEMIDDFCSNRFFIGLALQQIIEARTIIHNRYGYPVYLRADHSMVYTTREHPLSTVETTYDLHYYEEVLIGNTIEPLSNLLKSQISDLNQQLLSMIASGGPGQSAIDVSQLNIILDQMPMDQKIDLIEKILATTESSYQPAREFIRQKYRHAIFEFHEPLEALSIVSGKLRGVNENRKQGKHVSLEGPKMTQIAYQEVPAEITQTGPPVLVHNLWDRNIDRQKYGFFERIKTANRLRLIVFQAGQQNWRNPLFYEDPVYKSLVQPIITAAFAKFEAYDVYGIQIEYNLDLSIQNKSSKTTKKSQVSNRRQIIFGIESRLRQKLRETATGTIDNRSVMSGKDYTSYRSYELYDIMWYLQIPWPTQSYKLQGSGIEIQGSQVAVPGTREEILIALQPYYAKIYQDRHYFEKMSDAQLVFYYQWIIGSSFNLIKVNEMQELVKEILFLKGLVYNEVN